MKGGMASVGSWGGLGSQCRETPGAWPAQKCLSRFRCVSYPSGWGGGKLPRVEVSCVGDCREAGGSDD